MGKRRDGDLSLLSLSELQALRDRVDAEIEEHKTRSEQSVLDRGGLVERDGPRYRNPANSAETWSGKGHQPTWVKRALAAGITLEELEIVDDRPVRG